MNVKPCGYAVFAKEGDGPVIRIPGYVGSSEAEAKGYVLVRAITEGFKGTADERLAELGWWIEPIYRAPDATP